MDRMSDALRFPSGFGKNWDALADYLRDMDSWIPAEGHTVRLIGAEDLWKEDPMVAGTLVGVWLSAAEYIGTRLRKPFHLVFLFDSLATEPLTATTRRGI